VINNVQPVISFAYHQKLHKFTATVDGSNFIWHMDNPDLRGENMNNAYVAFRESGYWIADTRVSLDSIVYAFLDGQTPESIAQSFPVLTLEQVYGAVAFYLAHRSDIEQYLEQAKTDFETKRKASRESDPMFYQKLADARRLGTVKE
jgi:hypothetical protein